MFQRIVIALVFAAIVVVGCSTARSSNENYSGQYHNSYSRGINGTIVIGVLGDAVSIVIDDDVAGTFTGSGTLQGRTFDVVCTGATGTTTVSGSFTGSGSNRTVTGSASGVINFDFSANIQQTPNVASYAGGYAGNFTGATTLGGVGTSGTFSITVSETGGITGTLTVDPPPPGIGNPTGAISGSVSSVGSTTFSATVSGTQFTYTGVFRHTGSLTINYGTWSSSPGGAAGEWNGSNAS